MTTRHENMNAATLIIFLLCFAPVTLQSIEDNEDTFYKVGSRCGQVGSIHQTTCNDFVRCFSDFRR